ncbi:MAG TPA: hypothetical protein VIF15_20155 [Polyangiaceae bacterium]|jgi:hypothetical protein
MSLPQETMLELMALADGELDGEARQRAEKLVADSEEARGVLRAMEGLRSPALGAWLEESMESRSAAADGIADAVMARLASGDGGVVRLVDARARRASRVQVAIGATCAALALAAGIAVYIRSDRETVSQRLPVASVGEPSVDVAPPPSAPAYAAQSPVKGVEVDEIDSPSRSISVFQIPAGGPAAAAKASSVVIWIEDDKGSK